ncbi:hypothetical protein GN956_G27151 [Arapaima gigas]
MFTIATVEYCDDSAAPQPLDYDDVAADQTIDYDDVGLTKRLKSRLDLRPSKAEVVGTTPTSLLQGRNSIEADNADYDDVGEKHLQEGKT